MKYIITFFVLSFLSTAFAQNTTSVLGKWKTVDDETGEAKSVVEIYDKEGLVYGKIDQIINPADRDKTCIMCEGEEYNIPLTGLNIIKNLKEKSGKYEGGTIFDPENGKQYKAKIWVDSEEPNILNVRGYIAFLYRTQQWIRVK